MKTARIIYILIGLGVLAQGSSFAESSTEAPPRTPAPRAAAANDHSAGEEHGNQAHSTAAGKAEAGPSGEKHGDNRGDRKDAEHPAGKPDDKHTSVGSNQARTSEASPHENSLHQLKPLHNDQPHSIGKPAASFPSRVTPGYTTAQHPSVANKSAVATSTGLIVKKTPGISPRPVSPATGRLPTSPSIKASQGRIPGLASIGGPTKPVAGNTAAVNGTAIKYRP